MEKDRERKRKRNWYRTGKGAEASSYKLVMDCSGWNGESKASGTEIFNSTHACIFILVRYRSWWISKSRWKMYTAMTAGENVCMKSCIPRSLTLPPLMFYQFSPFQFISFFSYFFWSDWEIKTAFFYYCLVVAKEKWEKGESESERERGGGRV